MSPEFAKLLSQHIGNAFAKQLAFADVLGERNWGVNISEGRATFGDDLSYPIQLIGTEADGDSSWLWAWANEGSNLPPAMLRICSELKTIGEHKGVPELLERSYSLETATGHMVAMVASGLNPECCYYRGPYDGGALFFLVCDAPNEVTQHVAPERAITVLTEVISQFEIDHREMAESFLQTQGFDIESNGRAMVAARGGQSVELSFDSLNRIDNIQGTLSLSAPPKKSWWQFW
jgi:hypothetical protein